MRILLIALLLIVSTSHAGMFLDLAVGAHLTDWPDECYCYSRDLGDDNPIFVGRIGWQSKQADFIWKSNISLQVFYEHGSSAGTSRDTGYDLGMIGVRIE